MVPMGGPKVFIELKHNGWLKFVFQYIYYFFEAVLLMLILVFCKKHLMHGFINTIFRLAVCMCYSVRN